MISGDKSAKNAYNPGHLLLINLLFFMTQNMTRKKRLQDTLSSTLLPVFLDIQDESGNHQRPGVETHFKVILVSEKFKNTTRIARHREVNQLVADEFETGLHALSLHLYTPEEWEARGQSKPNSPPCHNQKTNTSTKI
jgi:BolA family transcriptional regulator, general stress-responsive regulator